MNATLRLSLSVAAGLLAACGSSTKTSAIPVPPDGMHRYVGTSPSDIWQIAPDSGSIVRHWDGSAWSDIDITSVGPADAGSVAGPGALWIRVATAEEFSFHRLGVDGSTEALDLPPPIEAPYDHFSSYSLSGWGGTLLVSVTGEATDFRERSRMYRRDGDAWTELPQLPEGVVFGGARVGADGEILAQTTDWTYTSHCEEVDPNQATVVNPVVRDDVMHGSPTPYLWLRDGAWVPLSGMRCIGAETSADGLAAASPTFPIDNLWARYWHFDGTLIRPLMVPGAMSYRAMYTYVDGETVRISEAPHGVGGSAGAASENDEFSCDNYGNCQPVGDTYAYVGTKWVAETWDGVAWTGQRKIADGQTCAGVGCIYVGDAPGIVGQLEDGTVLIHQDTDDQETTLALIEL